MPTGKYDVRPGGNATTFVRTAIATTSGAQFEPSGLINDATHKVTPLKSFSYIVGTGTKAFYAGMPVFVDANLRAALIAAGLVS